MLYWFMCIIEINLSKRKVCDLVFEIIMTVHVYQQVEFNDFYIIKDDRKVIKYDIFLYLCTVFSLFYKPRN